MHFSYKIHWRFSTPTHIFSHRIASSTTAATIDEQQPRRRKNAVLCLLYSGSISIRVCTCIFPIHAVNVCEADWSFERSQTHLGEHKTPSSLSVAFSMLALPLPFNTIFAGDRVRAGDSGNDIVTEYIRFNEYRECTLHTLQMGFDSTETLTQANPWKNYW